MNRFWNWLLVCPQSLGDVAKFVAKVTLFQLAWALVVGSLGRWVPGLDENLLAHHQSTPNPRVLIAVLPFVVAIEETCRLTPIMLVKGTLGPNRLAIMLASLATAFLFGIAHYYSNGVPLWSSIAVQGVGGFIMNAVYLKCGGLHGQKMRGFFAAYAVHYLYDCCLLGMAIAFSGY